ncbi:MAG: ABC transporter permease subunit [Geminicoccaceae bacterium]|nr:ABC transporter permease subunit [Geminicoccaceae bacterium]MCB9944823.1 ABC transporter permease subunit [Geminicoccaceae bacterium]
MNQLIEYLPLLLRGASVTVALAVLSLLLATLLGGLGAAAKIGGGTVARMVAAVYTTIVRGVPDLVLILLIYFGGQRLANDIGALFGMDYVEVSKFGAGIVSIGFIYGAYLTETFRGGYAAVPRGQREAAEALGLSPWITLRKVTLPQFWRHVLPGYGNVWQVLVKSTAVVSVIGLEDLVGLADKAGKSTREPFLFLVIVILVYLAITAVSGRLFAMAETHVGRGQTFAARGG